MDVTNLGLGQSVHVRDLKLGEGIKVLTDPDEVLVTVTAVKEEVAAPVAAPAETVEPEVIKKGKKEEKSKSIIDDTEIFFFREDFKGGT